jgi:hypothetical protein
MVLLWDVDDSGQWTHRFRRATPFTSSTEAAKALFQQAGAPFLTWSMKLDKQVQAVCRLSPREAVEEEDHQRMTWAQFQEISLDKTKDASAAKRRRL